MTTTPCQLMTTTPWGRGRRAIAAVAVSSLLAGAFLAGERASGAAPAAPLLAFDAAASADGMRVSLTAAGAPVTSEIVDLAGPTAQAVIDGLGRSQAFAALPDPGDTALTLPATAFPLIGLPTPPGYPLMARSDASTSPKAEVNEPGITLRATSAPRSSHAQAKAVGGAVAEGRASVSAAATTTLDEASGDLAALSVGSVESLDIKDVLRIGRTRATAEALQPPGGARVVDSSFTVEGLTVAGQSVAVTDQGIVLPGRTTPVPDTAGLNPVLDSAGISLRYLAATSNDGSVTSAGLVVSTKQAGPTGDTILTYTLGRASASASGSTEVQGLPAIPALPTLPDDASSATVDSPSVAEPVAEPVADGSSFAQDDIGASFDSGAPLPSVPEAAAPLSSAAPLPSADLFYLMLVFGGVVMTSGLVLVRIFGVRLLWT